MKVGLLELQAARLNAYWAAYLKELGVPLVTPALLDTEALALGQQSLPGEAVTVQLALGRILALGRVDAALVPHLPAVAADAWGEALAELLPRRISGLPALLAVPDDGADREALEGAATEVGLRLSQNAGRVRLALERVRPLAQGGKVNPPSLSRAGRATVAVIGPRALLAEHLLVGGLRPALEALGLHAVFSHDWPLPELLKRAERLTDASVPAGERELFGAASLLAGKSAVRGLVFAAPARDGATLAALHRVARKMHKPLLTLTLDAGQTEFPELTAFRDLITLGTAPTTAPTEEETA